MEELKSEGFQVIEASSADGAIDLIEAEPIPDVLFTDIRLAGVGSGWDVARELREISPEAAVLYASGQALDDRRWVSGSMAFSKPYLVGDIIDACRRLMPGTPE